MAAYLSGDECEVAGVAEAAPAPPVGEPHGVGRVLGYPEGVDEDGGERGLLEPVRAALAVEPREHEAERAEVVVPAAGPVGAVEDARSRARFFAAVRSRDMAWNIATSSPNRTVAAIAAGDEPPRWPEEGERPNG